MSKSISLFVQAKLVPGVIPTLDDSEIPGLYQVEVSGETPASALANAALDGFHSRIGVAELEDFEFTVLDGAKNALEEDADIESYSLEAMCFSVEYLEACVPTTTPADLTEETAQ